MIRLADGAARARAATALDVNLVVEAGAGTGKTSLIVERILHQILGRGDELLDVVAITFTEKAAAEMRERITDALVETLHLLRATGDLPNDETGRALARLRGEAAVPGAAVRERATRALAHVERARISTIHAFAADILRRNAREAGVDPDFVVDEGPVWEREFEEVGAEILADALATVPGGDRAWEEALLDFEIPDVIRTLRVMSLPEFPLDEVARRGEACLPAVETLLAGPLRALADRLEEMVEVRADDRTPVNVQRATLLAGTIRAVLRDGTRTLSELSPADWKSVENTKPSFTLQNPWMTEEDGKHLEAARNLILRMRRIDDAAYRRLVELLVPLARTARERYLGAGYVSFQGILVAARDLLRRSTGVRDAERRRFRTLLVDEFQDTDPVQSEIVLLLAGKPGEAEGDPWRVPLEPGRLFLVGDPRQSIYRFRGADFEAYRRAIRRIHEEGGEILFLFSNFRSTKPILTQVNRLFGNWIGVEEDPGSSLETEPRYVDLEAPPEGDRPDGAPAVEVWSVPAPGLPIREARRREAEWIAAAIAEMIRRGERKQSEIAILLRVFSDLSLYLTALRRRGIDFVVGRGRTFYQRDEVREFLAILRAISDPNDPVAVLAFLRSPLGGPTDAEIHAHALAGGGWSAARAVRSPAHARVAAALDRLARLAEGASRLPPDRVLRSLLTETPLAAVHALAFDGAQRVVNLRRLASLVLLECGTGLVTLDEGVRRVQQRFLTGADERESPLADEKVDAVRVLTIHSAKGLEWETVFIADVTRRPNDRADEQFEFHESPPPGGLAARSKNGAWSSFGFVRDLHDRAHEVAERKRLLYVATTRARERLILTLPIKKATEIRCVPWVAALGAWGYDAERFEDSALATPDEGRVTHRLCAGDPPPGRLEPREPADRIEPARRFLHARPRVRPRPPLSSPSGMREAREPVAETGAGRGPGVGALVRIASARSGSADRSPSRSLALEVGAAVHGALEAAASFGPADLRGAAERICRETARRSGLTGAPARQAAEEEKRFSDEVFRLVEGVTREPLRGFLAGARVLGKEVPMLWHEGDGKTWSGAIDLLLEDRNGRIVVADWKTDRETTMDEELLAEYGGTMRIYGESVRRALHLAAPPALVLLLLRGPRIVEIAGDPSGRNPIRT